jgi:rhodanese-related sulfurtransferase
MSLPTILPRKAQQLVKNGALLIDIREADEHARERIPGAVNRALSSLHEPLEHDAGKITIFHCKSGNRTSANARRLRDAALGEAYIVAGGFDAWKREGLPVLQDRKQPLELLRQVQIAAGSLVVAGFLLGVFVDVHLYALSALVGAGLILAGATGTCGMARILALAPWNRRFSNSTLQQS